MSYIFNEVLTITAGIGTGTPISGGADTRILFQKGTVLAEDPNFTWNYSNPADEFVNVNGTYSINSKQAISEISNVSGNNWFFANSGNGTLTGNSNFGFGDGCLGALTSGNGNTAVGNSVLGNITSASGDTGIGFQALNLCTGEGNTAVGYTAGFRIVAGIENDLLGTLAGVNISSGNSNTVLGCRDPSFVSTCGATITSGSQNIVIGAGCDVSSASANGQMSIGNFIYGTGLTGTGATISTGKIGIGTVAPSFNLHVKGDAPALGVEGVSGAAKVMLLGNSVGGTSSGTGFVAALGYNAVNNKQYWLGDPDYIGNSSANFIRFITQNGLSVLDCVNGDNSANQNLILGDSNTTVIAQAGLAAGSILYLTNNFDTAFSRSAAGVIALGNGSAVGDASATIKAKTKAGAPTTSDVPAGAWILIRDTTNSTTKLYYNNAGTLQTVALV